MLEEIYMIFLIIFAAIGVERCLYLIKHLIMKSSKQKMFLLIPAKGHNEGIEYAVRAAKLKTGTLSDSGEYTEVIILDLGMDTETGMVCRMMSKSNKNVRVCSMDELQRMILNQK